MDYRRAIVTGCCGRIGRAVANRLDEEGWHVIGIDRSPRPAALAAMVRHEQLDLCALDDDARTKLGHLMLDADAVVHLAACPDDADFERVLLPTNIAAVAALLQLCDQAIVARVAIASSGKVHAGHAGEYPIRLSDMPSPVCNYSASKLFAEGAAQAFAASTGTPTIALRFAWCPRVPADVAAMRAATAPHFGANEFLSADDAATCVAAALRVDADRLRAASPSAAPFTTVFCQSHPLDGQRAARFDLGPTRDLLGWDPADTFPAGVDELVASDYTDSADVYPRAWPPPEPDAAARRDRSDRLRRTSDI